MKTRKLSFSEAIQVLRESLNSEFDEEREIAQLLLNQHYGQRGCINNTHILTDINNTHILTDINNTKGDNYETTNEHKNRIQHKHIQ